MLQKHHIKLERIDSTSPPEQHLLQQQKHTYHHHHQGVVTGIRADSPYSHTNHEQDRESARVMSRLKNDDIESLPDFQSIKGMFGWTTIEGVNVPYILRSDKQFVSVRIVEMKLISRYPNSFSNDFKRCVPFKSFSVTENEAKLLNEINIHHCDEEYGKNNFDTKALIMPLTDFLKLFDTIKNAHFDATKEKGKHHHQQKAGWLQVENTITPYLCRGDGNYVPLYVIQYAAGLLTNKKVDSVMPTRIECEILNNLCKEVGVEFRFSELDRLIKIKDLLRVDPVDITTLPSSNPLKYATFKKIQMNNSIKSKFQVTQHPNIIQPNLNLDLPCIQSKGQTHFKPKVPPVEVNDIITDKNAKDSETFVKDECIRFAREQGKLAAMEQVKALCMQSLKITPIMQQNYEDNNNPQAQNILQQLQNKSNQQLLEELTNKLVTPGVKIHENDVHAKFQESGALVETFLRLRPNLGTQHGLRPPPLLSLSHVRPTLLSAGSQRFEPNPEKMVPSPNGLIPPLNPDINIHRLQAMFAQRLSFDLKAEQPKLHPAVIPLLTTYSHISRTPANTTQTQSKSPLLSMSKVTPSYPGKESSQKSIDKTKSLNIDGPTSIEQTTPIILKNVESRKEIKLPDHVENKPTFEKYTLNKESEKDFTSSDKIPEPQAGTKVNQSSSHISRIQGAWVGGKKISCLELKRDDRQGRYCLVEVVCQLYFEGCSINQLLYALKKVLKVPLLTCTDDEEKVFLKYYNLPIDAIKCNKMISFEDLESCFPHLCYMFPDKNAIDAFLGQGACGKNWNKLARNGKQILTNSGDAEQMTFVKRGMKRQQKDTSKKDQPRKKVRTNAKVADDISKCAITDGSIAAPTNCRQLGRSFKWHNFCKLCGLGHNMKGKLFILTLTS